jgi:DNA replication protein DnaC
MRGDDFDRHPCSTVASCISHRGYIGEHANILVIGEVGVGKRHLAH